MSSFSSTSWRQRYNVLLSAGSGERNENAHIPARSGHEGAVQQQQLSPMRSAPVQQSASSAPARWRDSSDQMMTHAELQIMTRQTRQETQKADGQMPRSRWELPGNVSNSWRDGNLGSVELGAATGQDEVGPGKAAVNAGRKEASSDMTGRKDKLQATSAPMMAKDDLVHRRRAIEAEDDGAEDVTETRLRQEIRDIEHETDRVKLEISRSQQAALTAQSKLSILYGKHSDLGERQARLAPALQTRREIMMMNEQLDHAEERERRSLERLRQADTTIRHLKKQVTRCVSDCLFTLALLMHARKRLF